MSCSCGDTKLNIVQEISLWLLLKMFVLVCCCSAVDFPVITGSQQKEKERGKKTNKQTTTEHSQSLRWLLSMAAIIEQMIHFSLLMQFLKAFKT